MNPTRATEALDLPFRPAFLRGLQQALPSVRIVHDLELANALAFSQHVRPGYRIWQDVSENWRGALRGHPRFDEARQFASAHLARHAAARSNDVVAYRKKRVRKQASAWDDFVFSDAGEDALHVITSVAINRYLDDYAADPFFDTVFDICRLGGWPCGMTADGACVAFDPATLAQAAMPDATGSTRPFAD